MGLDMYLSARKFLWTSFDMDKPNRDDEISNAIRGLVPEIGDMKPRYIEVEAMYWRKANHIHAWFVDNVQDGEDNCADYYVSLDNLKDLKAACADVLANKEDKVFIEDTLPPQAGFFFGSTDYDEWYERDLEYTVERLEKIYEDKLAAIDELKPGVYTFADCMDDVGPDTGPVEARVKVTIGQGRVHGLGADDVGPYRHDAALQVLGHRARPRRHTQRARGEVSARARRNSRKRRLRRVEHGAVVEVAVRAKVVVGALVRDTSCVDDLERLGDHDGPVSSASASDRHGQVVLPLQHILRQREAQKRHEFVQELERLGVTPHVANHLRITTRQRTESVDEVGIR